MTNTGTPANTPPAVGAACTVTTLGGTARPAVYLGLSVLGLPAYRVTFPEFPDANYEGGFFVQTWEDGAKFGAKFTVS